MLALLWVFILTATCTCAFQKCSSMVVHFGRWSVHDLHYLILLFKLIWMSTSFICVWVWWPFSSSALPDPLGCVVPVLVLVFFSFLFSSRPYFWMSALSSFLLLLFSAPFPSFLSLTLVLNAAIDEVFFSNFLVFWSWQGGGLASGVPVEPDSDILKLFTARPLDAAVFGSWCSSCDL